MILQVAGRSEPFRTNVALVGLDSEVGFDMDNAVLLKLKAASADAFPIVGVQAGEFLASITRKIAVNSLHLALSYHFHID